MIPLRKFFVVFFISALFYLPFPLIAMDPLQEGDQSYISRIISILGDDGDPLELAKRLIKEYPKAYDDLLEQASNFPTEAFNVALYLEKIGETATALSLYEKIGDVDSLLKAAEFYQNGILGVPNRGQAIKLYEAAAKKESTWAKRQLRIILTQWAEEDLCTKGGRGTLIEFLARNPQLKTEVSDPEILLRTGVYLEVTNPAEALSCYIRAGELGSVLAALNASVLLKKGFRGQSPAPERASQLLSLARRLGFPRIN